MEDQHLERLLKELPQEQARPGFTARVLARLDTAPPARVRWQPRLTAVVAVAVALTAGLVYNSRLEAEKAAKRVRAERILRELRAEHGRIKKELEALPEEPPVLYLGGDEKMDLVVNLRTVPRTDGRHPATYQYDTF
jgi:hypothetical protein